MWILIGAVLTASVLGSLHCVGMCGPLALWASGAGEGNARLAVNSSLYHFGRMLTYALVGLLAGLAGQVTDFGGEVLGVQLAAARIVGLIMVVMGALQVMKWWALRRGSQRLGLVGWLLPKPNNGAVARQSLVSKWLVSLRPRVFSLSPPTRAWVTGLLTALLPCGWLYLFALFAAGTGNWLSGSVVMLAFWLGSVPALVGVVLSTKLLAGRLRQFVPVAVALMTIIAGGFTMAGRGFANLHSLSEIPVPTQGVANDVTPASPTHESITKSLGELVKTPLPCCQVKPD
jgi:uncharacterized protein